MEGGSWPHCSDSQRREVRLCHPKAHWGPTAFSSRPPPAAPELSCPACSHVQGQHSNTPSLAVIQKLPNNKAYSVGLALSTLWSQLSLLPVPHSEEQIQADDYGLCQCCTALTEFTRPFVEDVANNKENERLKHELLKL